MSNDTDHSRYVPFPGRKHGGPIQAYYDIATARVEQAYYGDI